MADRRRAVRCTVGADPVGLLAGAGPSGASAREATVADGVATVIVGGAPIEDKAETDEDAPLDSEDVLPLLGGDEDEGKSEAVTPTTDPADVLANVGELIDARQGGAPSEGLDLGGGGVGGDGEDAEGADDGMDLARVGDVESTLQSGTGANGGWITAPRSRARRVAPAAVPEGGIGTGCPPRDGRAAPPPGALGDGDGRG